MSALAAAIVLAAGEGRRMGGPKADLVAAGRTLAVRHVDRLREVGAARIVVVVRAAPVRAAGDVTWVVAATDSQAASLAAGAARLADLAADAAVLVTPVDLVPPAAATYLRLVAALTADPALVAVSPTHEGHGGHPVILRAGALAPYRAAGPWPRLDTRLAALGAARARIAVDDAAIRGDLDTPADLAASR